MKAVILAGGFGTRISEESHTKPKPMIEIGGKPILWHILKIYSNYGINEFIICCGYKGYVIKEYFANYFLHTSDITFNLEDNTIKVHERNTEPWKITLVNTGENTMTGGRLKRVSNYLINEKMFCLTYGDGLANIDIQASIDFHLSHQKLATITAVKPPGRYGAIELIDEQYVKGFTEKPPGQDGYINGGFFVLSTKVLDFIDGDHTSWENEPLNTLAKQNQLMAFIHKGFWQPMDTLREKKYLEDLWENKTAPWHIWE
tara:strand:+ start:3443 stop:4219 length:777 start_codon:yes stop_codon:yes gene_type:complete